MSGLSMDYEVFPLSRVRERYDTTGAWPAASSAPGGVITRPTLVPIVMVGAFSAPGGRFIKLTGIGMIIALIMGAFVARVLLRPGQDRPGSRPPGRQACPGNVIERRGRPGRSGHRVDLAGPLGVEAGRPMV